MNFFPPLIFVLQLNRFIRGGTKLFNPTGDGGSSDSEFNKISWWIDFVTFKL